MFHYLKFLINIYLINFFIVFWGLFIVRGSNLLLFLILIDLAYFLLSLIFVLYSILYDQIKIQIFILNIMVLSASETALGLGILIFYFKVNNHLNLNYLYNLKG